MANGTYGVSASSISIKFGNMSAGDGPIPHVNLIPWPRPNSTHTLTPEENKRRDMRDHQGNTPTHKAVGHGDLVKLEGLIACGANLRLKNHDGDEAIHLATREGRTEAVEMLLHAGHGVHARVAQEDGILRRRPLDIAPEEVADARLRRLLEVWHASGAVRTPNDAPPLEWHGGKVAKCEVDRRKAGRGAVAYVRGDYLLAVDVRGDHLEQLRLRRRAAARKRERRFGGGAAKKAKEASLADELDEDEDDAEREAEYVRLVMPMRDFGCRFDTGVDLAAEDAEKAIKAAAEKDPKRKAKLEKEEAIARKNGTDKIVNGVKLVVGPHHQPHHFREGASAARDLALGEEGFKFYRSCTRGGLEVLRLSKDGVPERPHLAAARNPASMVTPLLLCAACDSSRAEPVMAILTDAMMAGRYQHAHSPTIETNPLCKATLRQPAITPAQRALSLQTHQGFTALHWACITRRAGIARLLIDCGAKIDAASQGHPGKSKEHVPPGQAFGQTALMKAAQYGSPTCVDLLTRAGADQETRDSRGRTALHFAAALGSAECVRLLIAAMTDAEKASPNSPLRAADDDGHVALERAVQSRDARCVKLIDHAGGGRDELSPEKRAEIDKLEQDDLFDNSGSFVDEGVKGCVFLCAAVCGVSLTGGSSVYSIPG